MSTIQNHQSGSGLDEFEGPFRFDRRQRDRWPMDGGATAFQLAGDSFGRMHALHMHDYSEHGMGAISETPIPPGSIVSVGFQAPGHLAKRGEVIRCEPCGEGYRVAIIFEHRMVA